MLWSDLLKRGWVEADNGHGCYGYNLFLGDPKDDAMFILTCDGENAPDYPVDGEPARLGLYDAHGYCDQRPMSSPRDLERAKSWLLARYERSKRRAA